MNVTQAFQHRKYNSKSEGFLCFTLLHHNEQMGKNVAYFVSKCWQCEGSRFDQTVTPFWGTSELNQDLKLCAQIESNELVLIEIEHQGKWHRFESNNTRIMDLQVHYGKPEKNYS
jgi:hypothetical protein